MARITRCTYCFNPVLRDAAVCPHCNAGRTPETRPRLLGRKAWTFILLALVVFAAIDVAILVKEKERRARTQVLTSYARAALVQSLSHPGLVIDDAFSDIDPGLAGLLEKALPADEVARVNFTRLSGHSYVRRKNGFMAGRHHRVNRYRFDVVTNKAGKYTQLRGRFDVIQDGNESEVYQIRIDAGTDLGATFTPRPIRPAEVRFSTPVPMDKISNRSIRVAPSHRTGG